MLSGSAVYTIVCAVGVAVRVSVFSSACAAGVLIFWTGLSHVAPSLAFEALYWFFLVLLGAEPTMVVI